VLVDPQPDVEGALWLFEAKVLFDTRSERALWHCKHVAHNDFLGAGLGFLILVRCVKHAGGKVVGVGAPGVELNQHHIAAVCQLPSLRLVVGHQLSHRRQIKPGMGLERGVAHREVALGDDVLLGAFKEEARGRCQHPILRQADSFLWGVPMLSADVDF